MTMINLIQQIAQTPIEVITLDCNVIEVDPMIIAKMHEQLSPRPVFNYDDQAGIMSELERIMRSRA